MTDCKNCGRLEEFKPTIFKDEDFCCDHCRKVLSGEIDPFFDPYFFTERDTNVPKTAQYVRKPFYVEAVQVTVENMEDVTNWCKGSVESDLNPSDNSTISYVLVDVINPLNDRQRRAYVGCWVLRAAGNFKVYTDKAFKNTFNAVVTAPVTSSLEAAAV